MKKIVDLTVILTIPVFSQPSFVIHSGLNSPLAYVAVGKYDFLADHWKNGINIDIGFEIPVFRLIALAPSFEYTYYAFEMYNPGIQYVENQVGLWPSRNPKDSRGSGSHTYKLLLEAKAFTEPSRIVAPYVSTGIGYAIEDIGAIEASWEDLNGGQYVTNIQYEGKSFLIHSFGFGLRSFLAAGVSMDFAARYFTNYTDRFSTSLNLGFAYRLD